MSQFIPKDFIDTLLTRINIVDCIEKRIPLKKKGRDYSACCPFHEEKTPSFYVSEIKQLYHCFGCAASGNLITFIMEYDRVTYPEAIEILATQAGLTIPTTQHTTTQPKVKQTHYTILQHCANYYRSQLRDHAAGAAAIDYLKQRGLTGEIAKTFGIGLAPPGWNNLQDYFKKTPEARELLLTTGMLIQKDQGRYYDRFRHRIMFPIRNRQGKIIAFGGRTLTDEPPKYLNSPETPLFHKSTELYGLYECLQARRHFDQIIVVEGYMDVVGLFQHGINYAVATLGTATSKSHIQQLFRYSNKIIFCFDGDRAGEEAAWRALETALTCITEGYQIHFMFLPQGEDPDSYIRKVGKISFEEELKQTISLVDFFFNKLQSQTNIHSLEGKAHFIKIALPLLKQMQENALQHMMLDQLSKLVRIETERLKIMMQSSANPRVSTEISAEIKPLTFTPLRLVTALLLQNPELIQAFPSKHALDNLTLPECDILLELIPLIQEKPNATSAILLEHWRDREEYPLLASLASWRPLPHTEPATAFKEALERLTQQSETYQIEQWMQKATQQGLTSEEKQELQKLIQKNKKISANF
ncbi:MAG: DNA primase [Proteobacteria bacterium]|nr:DNA primase [Pseudomonadota bacterium]